ncbi:TIGR03619 family F420-dependent LLM class oxidoreductase [Streptomyces sp. NPDC057950]|uniref:TIGR03619 family F420-dependent LLM class oxidoreductase n=1 Tax=Streptomyces sp. NPDC057950 TaxID=3346288 RepID=UPI0036E43C7B
MRLGFSVPQFGVFAKPALTADLSRRLEDMGYDSLWVSDRLLGPLSPSDPYPDPSRDGVMPEEFVTSIDPLSALTVAAAHTEHIRLGTSTLNAMFQPPVLLARTLASLDLISNGRVDVGLGLGWLRDEYQAVGVPWRGRGARLEEVLDVLDAVWTCETVRHEGPLWTIPPSRILPKPVQKPRPPILLAGFSTPALERIGRRADGWIGLAMPLEQLTGLWNVARQAAEQAGRDPSQLRVCLRVNPTITKKPGDPAHNWAAGTVSQVSEYLAKACEAGADEAFIDVQTTTSSVTEMMDIAEAFIDEFCHSGQADRLPPSPSGT